ncbi:MAG: hypothetical protein KAQ87_01890 [Candidatus Pacebacteria bacterium]|nr:hypothetical protein [Candidatus Paceibacterota bacterium]
MFKKLKEKINLKKRKIKKAAFLAVASYLYDKVVGRKKLGKKKEYLEDVEYEVEEKK